MKYFACFRKDGSVDSSWERENENNHPGYIPKNKIKELTEEQYQNLRFLILDKDKVKFKKEYDDYKATKYKKDRRIEYAKIDHLAMEALIESNLGDDTKWNAYASLRDAIKLDIPKP